MTDSDMDPAERLIEVRGLGRHFGEVEAVRDISFSVGRGEVVGFLGPNGAGKSTTMQMLVGALAPSAGSVHIDGLDLLEEPALARARLGYLAEQPPLHRELTVDEYLRFCARLRGLGGARLRDAVAAARARCGLDEVGRRLIGNLSKGFQQRVGIAQAIVHRPRIVVLDEPTAGLDPNQIRQIRALVRELGDAHCVLLSTHILAEVQSVCDRVLILDRGRIVLDQTLAELTAGNARTHRLRVRDLPPHWPEVSGVQRFEVLADGAIRVHHDGRTETIEALAQYAAGWGLRELLGEGRSLEELFVALTQREGTVALATVAAGAPGSVADDPAPGDP